MTNVRINQIGTTELDKGNRGTIVTGTTATSGDQTLVAAPGTGLHLVIEDAMIQNESITETTVILKDGSTAKRRAKLAANAALTIGAQIGKEWHLSGNSALVLNLSGANSHGYSVQYRTEAD